MDNMLFSLSGTGCMVGVGRGVTVADTAVDAGDALAVGAALADRVGVAEGGGISFGVKNAVCDGVTDGAKDTAGVLLPGKGLAAHPIKRVKPISDTSSQTLKRRTRAYIVVFIITACSIVTGIPFGLRGYSYKNHRG